MVDNGENRKVRPDAVCEVKVVTTTTVGGGVAHGVWFCREEGGKFR